MTTILVVEDNPLLREGIMAMLDAEGFRVLTAGDGAEALLVMSKAVPDLILCDISMPVMDGYTFFDKVRENTAWITIPFIFLTARNDREDLLQSKVRGVEDYLVKPISRLELVTTIRARLSRHQQLQIAQLQQAYQSSLILLSNAIELRDRYTRGHVERVMAISLSLAEEMGIRNGIIPALRLGSILHDIGKIHIREEVLHKPGPLDEDEWREIRKHPLVGADLIRNIPYLSPALPVIRHHHERWDGSGYPDGLSGAEIPLAARLVAVADSLDAMTSARTYQPSLTPERAYDEILQGTGKLYDPEVVDVLQAAWPGILTRMGEMDQGTSASANAL